MSIGYRGNATQSGMNGQDLTIALTALGGGSGSAVQPGDCVVVAGMCPSPNGAPAWPAGYTNIDNGLTIGNTARLVAAYKFMGPSPDATVLFTGDADANSSVGCCAYVLTGMDPTTPLDGVAVVSATGSSTNPNPAATTPATAGATVLVIAMSRVAETGVTNPTNYTNQAFVNATADTNDCSLAIAMRTGRPAGVSEDPGAFAGWLTGAWRTLTITLRPQAVQTQAVLASTTPVPAAARATSKPVRTTTTPVSAALRALARVLLVSTTLLATVGAVPPSATVQPNAGVWIFSGHCPAATGLQDCVSDEMLARGITPKLVEGEVGFNVITNDGTPTIHCLIGFGAYDGTNYGWAASASRDNVTTSETWRDQGTDKLLASLNVVDGSASYAATVSAFIPGGVRLNWSAVGGGNSPVRFVLLFYGGADYRGKVTSKNLGTGTSAIPVTDIGFALQAGRLFCTGAANASGPEGFFGLNLGRFLADNTQKSVSFVSQDAVAGDAPGAYIASARALICATVGAASLSWEVTTSNVNSSGFDITPSVSAGSDDVLIVAHDFGGLAVSLFDFSTATAVGDQALTTPGFKPQFFESIGTNLASRNTAQFDVAAAGGIGMGFASRWDSGGFGRVVGAAVQGSLTSTTSATITLPAGILAGDKLFVFVTSRGHTSGTARVSVTDSSGVGSAWALAQGGAAESSTRQASIWFKDGVAGMSGTITVSGAVNSVASLVLVLRGCGVSGDPMAGVTIQTNASGAESHAAITPGENDTLVGLAVFNTASAQSVTTPDATNPALMLLNANAPNSGGSGCGVAVGSAMQIKAATTGALTWAQTNAATTSMGFYLITSKVKNWAFAGQIGITSPSDGNNISYGDACLIAPTNIDITATRAMLTSFDSTGVTLTYGKASGSATMCFGFALAQGTVDQYALGATTPVASDVLQTGKNVLGSTTPVGAVVKAMGEVLRAIANTVPTLAMTKQKNQAVLASTTPVPSLSRVGGRLVQAVTTPVPALVRAVAKALRVSTTPVPSDVLQTSKLVRVSTTPVPTLASTKAFLRAVLGSTTPVPTLARVGGRAVLASTTPVPSLRRASTRAVLAVTTPVGSLVRAVAKFVRTVTTPVPTLGAVFGSGIINQAVQAFTTPVASLTRSSARAVLAVTTPVPSLVRQLGKLVQAFTTPGPTLSTFAGPYVQALLASTTPVPSLSAWGFGSLKGTMTGGGASILGSNAFTGSIPVEVGDLIFVTFAQQTALTATGASDNLGNTYAAQNAGSLSTVSGRGFYSIATVAGTLTQVSVAATASSNDFGGGVMVIRGPFQAIDANPANLTADLSSPFSCPPTGVLSSTPEVVVAWSTMVTSATNYAATAPNTLAVATTTQNNARVLMGYQTVTATTSVTPQFTGTNPTASVLGTASFKKQAGAPIAYLQSVLAEAAAVASLVLQTGKRVLASTTPVPTLARGIAKALQAVTTPVPTLSAIGVRLRSVLASTTPVPSLARLPGRTVQAVTTPVGRLVRQTGKLVLASTVPVGSLVRRTSKLLAAITTPLAALTRSRLVRLQAIANAVATLVVQALGPVQVDPKYLLMAAAKVRGVFPAFVRGLVGVAYRRHDDGGVHIRGFKPDKKRDEDK